MEEQPAQQGFKAGRLAIGGRIGTSGAPSGTVAAAAHKIAFSLPQQSLKPTQGPGLGLGAHSRHHLAVQITRAGRCGAVAQTLMQLPHRIPQPGELLGTQLRGRGWRGHC